MPIGNRTLQTASVCVVFALAALTSASAASKANSRQLRVSTTHTSSRHQSSRHVGKRVSRVRGQRTIDEERTLKIQSALIREHYLSGEPTGVWDQASKDAMIRYQADNGWQTKITPDSRALIKLGLGPDHKGLLNPETANIPSPHELGVDTTTQPGGAADSE